MSTEQVHNELDFSAEDIEKEQNNGRFGIFDFLSAFDCQSGFSVCKIPCQSRFTAILIGPYRQHSTEYDTIFRLDIITDF